MKHILVDMPIDREALKRLQSCAGVTVEAVEPSDEARDMSPEILRDKHILFCTVPPTNLHDMNTLELIQISSVGYSQLYGLRLAERGIRVCNARGVFDVPIAEWNIAMMVNLARDLRGMIRNQEHGVWERPARFQREIRGLAAGLWGYGGIGRETARQAKALGMQVHVLTRNGVARREGVYGVLGTGDPEGTLPDRVFTRGQEKEFLAGLDFLILSMPQTPSTTGIVGEAELRCLPPTAYVLNPARGPLIQEEALLRALREGWIAGVALDTHYYYPMPADHPLWRFPNVILTPHVSGSDQNPCFLRRIWDVFAQNVERHLDNQPLWNELTPAQLAGE